MPETTQEIVVELEPPQEPVQRAMSLAETVTVVGQYMRTILDSQGDPKLWEIAEKLGWTVEQLQTFRDDHADLVALDAEIAWAAPPEPILPPTDTDLLEPDLDTPKLLKERPSDDEVAMAVERADRRLAAGLKAIGLTDREVECAEALQKLNNGHFRESMEIVSSTVLRTDLKCVMQQDEILERINEVRTALKEYGTIPSDERQMLVKEERMLMQQFLELGQLTVNIQQTWYKGAAELALIKMRYGRGGPGSGISQRGPNKPGFRPTV